MTSINTQTADARQLYRLLIECVVPRPIAWVSTRSKAGVTNLAPFSFFNILSSNPPILGFSPGLKRREGELVPKDTLQNVMDTSEFVVHIVSEPLANQMNQSSGEYARTVSELDITGLTAIPSDMVNVSRVKEARVAMECKLFQIVELGPESRLVLGRILCLHVDDEIMIDGRVDVRKLQPIGRLGGDQYSKTTDVFSMPRPHI